MVIPDLIGYLLQPAVGSAILKEILGSRYRLPKDDIRK